MTRAAGRARMLALASIAIGLEACCAVPKASEPGNLVFNWYLVSDEATCGDGAAPCVFVSLINYGTEAISFDELVVIGTSDPPFERRVGPVRLESGRLWTHDLGRFHCRLPLQVELRASGRAAIQAKGPRRTPIEMSREGLAECAKPRKPEPGAAGAAAH